MMTVVPAGKAAFATASAIAFESPNIERRTALPLDESAAAAPPPGTAGLGGDLGAASRPGYFCGIGVKWTIVDPFAPGIVFATPQRSIEKRRSPGPFVKTSGLPTPTDMPAVTTAEP